MKKATRAVYLYYSVQFCDSLQLSITKFIIIQYLFVCGRLTVIFAVKTIAFKVNLLQLGKRNSDIIRILKIQIHFTFPCKIISIF